MNPILNTDSYKFGHFNQYPEEVTTVVSHIAPRWSKDNPEIKEVVFMGLGAWIHDYVSGKWRITQDHVDEAAALAAQHGVNFNRDGWELIVNAHGGWLPIEIWALPEGTVVPLGTPVLQIRNTDARLPWLTSFVETDLLRAIWYPSTVASISRAIRKMILGHIKEWHKVTKLTEAETGLLQVLPFMLHDFGARGATSAESAAVGGMGHLTQFKGTDNLLALELIKKVYGVPCAGYSVEAAEHSTVTSWGPRGEAEMYQKMISQAKPNQIVSIVSDSYDLMYAVEEIFGKVLKQDILALGARGGKLVVRPDSGDPVKTPIGVVKSLYKAFRTNLPPNTPFGMLPSFLGVLQGDGIDYWSIDEILRTSARQEHLSPGNFVFGMGGGLLQKVNRDTFGFAMKANAVRRGLYSEFLPIGKRAVGKKSIEGLIRIRPGFGVDIIKSEPDLYENNLMERVVLPCTVDDTSDPAAWVPWSWDEVCDRAQFISVTE